MLLAGAGCAGCCWLLPAAARWSPLSPNLGKDYSRCCLLLLAACCCLLLPACCWCCCWWLLLLLLASNKLSSLTRSPLPSAGVGGYCPVIWCLPTNKRRPCSSTLSGHPSSSFVFFWCFDFAFWCFFLFFFACFVCRCFSLVCLVLSLFLFHCAILVCNCFVFASSLSLSSSRIGITYRK